jgi:hypothetical protein
MRFIGGCHAADGATRRPRPSSPGCSTCTSRRSTTGSTIEFREVWGETDQVIGDLDRRQAINDALYGSWLLTMPPRHVSAAKLYLEAVREMSPEREVSAKALGMLTDAELDLMTKRALAEAP